MTPHPLDELSDAAVWAMAEELFLTSAKKGRGLAKKTLVLREHINDAFEDVDKPVTIRQMFYLMSARGAVDKTEAGYGKVQRQLLAMRREGLVPYDWIADNTRMMRKAQTYASLADYFARSANFYRQDVWIKTGVYVEVWCEKDALLGTIFPVTSEFDVPLMVARGYSSESFLYSAAEAIMEQDKPAYIYYIGDFDPSGWHISQKLEERLREFGADFQFERLAVNPDQIDSFALQTRPTKSTDSRSVAFFREFGEEIESVDADAIHPNDLREMVREAIVQHIDPAVWKAAAREESAAREALEQLAERGFS